MFLLVYTMLSLVRFNSASCILTWHTNPLRPSESEYLKVLLICEAESYCFYSNEELYTIPRLRLSWVP